MFAWGRLWPRGCWKLVASINISSSVEFLDCKYQLTISGPRSFASVAVVLCTAAICFVSGFLKRTGHTRTAVEEAHLGAGRIHLLQRLDAAQTERFAASSDSVVNYVFRTGPGQPVALTTLPPSPPVTITITKTNTNASLLQNITSGLHTLNFAAVEMGW